MFRKFIRQVILFLIPIFILVLAYFIFDPFYILRTYSKYGSNFKKCYNRNKISTDVFLEHNDKLKYNSFIFGSSRSSAFKTKDFGKYIKNSSVYHFDAFDENLKGVLGKMKYINAQGNKIDNALIILCEDSFNDTYDKKKSIIHLKDPRWSDINLFEYHITFLKAFLTKTYFIGYFDLLIFDKYRPYMKDFFSTTHYYDDYTNDFSYPIYDKEIQQDSIKYYAKEYFTTRYVMTEISPAEITPDYLSTIHEIKKILNKNKTNYKIIIGPNFRQAKVNINDLTLLKQTFGSDRIFDYSGKNKYSTNIAYWYEPFHYKTQVGKEILNYVFSRIP